MTVAEPVRVLTTDRLKLRPFAAGDEPFIVELLNEEAFLRHIGDKGVRNNADATRYLAHGPIASYSRYGFGLLLVEQNSDGKPVGMCGLIRREDQPHPDIGYAFLAEYHGRGYAFESAQVVLRHAKEVLGIETVLAFVDPDNDRSIHLLRKLGMICQGQSTIEGIPLPQTTFSTTGAT